MFRLEIYLFIAKRPIPPFTVFATRGNKHDIKTRTVKQELRVHLTVVWFIVQVINFIELVNSVIA